MKTLLRFGILVVAMLLSLAIALLWSVNARADTYRAEFAYTADPDAPPTGFALYRLAGDDLTTVLDNIGPNDRTFLVDLPAPDPFRCDTYFMAALFGDGRHNGPYSRAYPLCPEYPLPAGAEVRISGSAVFDLIFRRVDAPGGE